jgi:hypothetical protein
MYTYTWKNVGAGTYHFFVYIDDSVYKLDGEGNVFDVT